VEVLYAYVLKRGYRGLRQETLSDAYLLKGGIEEVVQQRLFVIAIAATRWPCSPLSYLRYEYA